MDAKEKTLRDFEVQEAFAACDEAWRAVRATKAPHEEAAWRRYQVALETFGVAWAKSRCDAGSFVSSLG